MVSEISDKQKSIDMLALREIVNGGGYYAPSFPNIKDKQSFYERYGLEKLANSAADAVSWLMSRRGDETALAVANFIAKTYAEAAATCYESLSAELYPNAHYASMAKDLLDPRDEYAHKEFLVVRSDYDGIIDIVATKEFDGLGNYKKTAEDGISTRTFKPYYLPAAADILAGRDLEPNERLATPPFISPNLEPNDPERVEWEHVKSMVQEFCFPAGHPACHVRVFDPFHYHPSDDYLRGKSIAVMSATKKGLKFEFDASNYIENNLNLRSWRDNPLVVRFDNGDVYRLSPKSLKNTGSGQNDPRELVLEKVGVPANEVDEDQIVISLRSDISIEDQIENVLPPTLISAIYRSEEVAQIRKEIELYQSRLRGAPIMEFPNGEYRYVNFDTDRLEVTAGFAFNAGYAPDWDIPSVPIEKNVPLDRHLETLYEEALMAKPELAVEGEEMGDEESASQNRGYGR